MGSNKGSSRGRRGAAAAAAAEAGERQQGRQEAAPIGAETVGRAAAGTAVGAAAAAAAVGAAAAAGGAAAAAALKLFVATKDSCLFASITCSNMSRARISVAADQEKLVPI